MEVPPLIGIIHTHIDSSPDPSFDDINGSRRGLLNFVLHPDSNTLTMFDETGYITRFTYEGKTV